MGELGEDDDRQGCLLMREHALGVSVCGSSWDPMLRASVVEGKTGSPVNR